MNEYFVVYIRKIEDINGTIMEYGSCLICSNKTGRELVYHLIDELHKQVNGAIMINFIKL